MCLSNLLANSFLVVQMFSIVVCEIASFKPLFDFTNCFVPYANLSHHSLKFYTPKSFSKVGCELFGIGRKPVYEIDPSG